MFKKTKIAAVTAAVLGMSSLTAQAVSLNDAGSQGQVLVFPYYNVNGSFLTSFNITNTTGETKAVKIRYRTSKLSNDVLDFNLYMSPYDVFTMTLRKVQDGGIDKVNLTTQDKTCTHPTIPASGVVFRDVYASAAPADLLEGYLEVIEMGVVTDSDVQAGVLHDSSGTPDDCGVIEDAWQNGDFTSGGSKANTGGDNVVFSNAAGYPAQPRTEGYYGEDYPNGISAPTGGLVGSSILIDVNNVAGYVAEPLSVLNYTTHPQHYLSSDESFYLLPSLASGDVRTSEFLAYNGSMPNMVVNAYPTVKRDWGIDDPNSGREGIDNPRVPSGINPMPIADAMLVTHLGNQYFLGQGTHTDWVVAAPMRKHAIYNNYQYKSSNSGYTQGGFVVQPDGTTVCVGDVPVSGVCGDPSAPGAYWDYLPNANDVNASLKYWDREEQETSVDPGDFSPPLVTPPTEIPFPREVNILALNASGDASTESVLGSENAQGIKLAPGFVNGWGLFSFNNYNLNGVRYDQWLDNAVDYERRDAIGVPMHGFMASRSGVGRANVGETFPHFTTRDRDCIRGSACMIEPIPQIVGLIN